PEVEPPHKAPSEEIEVDVDVDEEALAMWDVVGNVTPLPIEEEGEDEEHGIVIDDLMLNSTEKLTPPRDPDVDPDDETTRPGELPPRPMAQPTHVPQAVFAVEVPKAQSHAPPASAPPVRPTSQVPTSQV